MDVKQEINHCNTKYDLENLLVMDDESLSTLQEEEPLVRVESQDKHPVEEDVNLLIEELEDRAIRDSILGQHRRNMVDYTWEEMKEITKGVTVEEQKEEEKEKASRGWRPDPYESIKDLIKPEFNIHIPDPIEIPFCNMESDDNSTESDEPPKAKKRVLHVRNKPDNLNGYSTSYWQTREHVKHLRIGNDLGVVTTLTVMADLDYSDEEVGYGIIDFGGLETLINLALINHTTIQICTLRVLSKLSDNYFFKEKLVAQGVPIACFRALAHFDLDIVNSSSDVLLKLSDVKQFRPVIRNSIGLEVMLEIAELPDKFYTLPEQKLSDEIERKKYYAAKNCLMAIQNAHRSRLVRLALYKLGFVRLLGKLIHSKNKVFKKIGMQMLSDASSVNMYREIFVLEGYMKFSYVAYKSLKEETDEAILMIKTVYKCLRNDTCRRFLIKNRFFEYLVDQFIKLTPQKQMKYTLACMVEFLKIKSCRLYMIKQEIVPKLLENFKHSNARMREYSGRIVAELSRYSSIHETLIGEQYLGLNWLLDMCDNLIDYDLLAHVYKIVMELSYSPGVFWWVVDRIEVIPLLWSAVNNHNPRCIEYGCSALAPYIGPVPDSHDIVRQITGGMYYLLQQMSSGDDGSKAGAITLLSRIANDDRSLTILEYIGFIDRLLEISKTAEHPRLRYAIGLAFGSVGHERDKSFDLGKRGAVNVLIEWLLNDKDPYVMLGVVTGLWKLSFEKINCMVMIKSDIVDRLVEIMAFDIECLHNSVAGLLTNMRRLAREAEWVKFRNEVLPQESILGSMSDADLIRPYQYPDEEEPSIYIQ